MCTNISERMILNQHTEVTTYINNIDDKLYLHNWTSGITKRPFHILLSIKISDHSVYINWIQFVICTITIAPVETINVIIVTACLFRYECM